MDWVRRTVPHLALILTVSGPVVQRACDATPMASPDEVFETVDGVRFRVEVVATNLVIPWSLAFAPDGRLFFTERPGRVRIIENGSLRAEPALTLTDVFARGEAGLLGLALHPRFDENGHVFLVYTVDRPGQTPLNRVMRYRELAGSLAEGIVIFDAPQGNTLHDGGRLRFGPDDKLYLTMGDALDLDLPQDLASSNGKIFRLEDDGRTPADNPFGSPVYTYGHRNPQGLDWHPITGDLWATEHGATGNDEINLIQPGGNYGWPVIEGAQSMPGMRTPVRFFTPSIAPSGASFYTGSAFPAFEHDLFFGALGGNHLHRVRLNPQDPSLILDDERLLAGRFGRIRDVVPGPDGALYFSTSNRDGRGPATDDDDRIARLVPK